MKKVLTGFSNNVTLNKNKIRVWVESFRKYSDGDVVLIVANATEEDIKTCDELNIKYYLVTENDLHYVNHKRLIHTKNYLLSSDGDVFIITDVFDVAFQSNPFEKLDFQNYNLFFTGEGVLLCEEPWNFDVVNRVFGSKELHDCLNHEIVCSGVIAGKKEDLINLYDMMFDKCELGTNDHNIKDQAALLVLLSQNKISNYKILNLNDAWAMHCATSGPTRFLVEWGFKNRIESRYNVPKLVDDVVCTNDGRTFDIVHQFNRVPEWHKIFDMKYNTEL